MQKLLKYLACIACGASLVLSGCGGGDDNNSNGNAQADDSDNEAILSVLSSSFPSLTRFANSQAKIQAAISYSSSYGPPPTYLPATVTATITHEAVPMASGTAYIDGTMTVTVTSQTELTATFNLTETLANCTAEDGSTVSGTIAITGNLTMHGTAATITMNASSSNFTVDGTAHTFALVLNATINAANGTFSACSITGTIDGQAVNESCM